MILEPALTTVFVLKLCLVPSLVYFVTLIGRRWGPNAAGWFSALPIVAGPILLTMAFAVAAGAALVVQLLSRRGMVFKRG